MIVRIVEAHCDHETGCPTIRSLSPETTQAFIELARLGWEIRLEGHGSDAEVKTYCPEHTKG